MQETFPQAVASVYDKIMDYFDYGKSAQIIDGIIKDFSKGVISPHILEIGIGTGACALELITLGYRVEGIDHSSAMLAEAQKKFSGRRLPISRLHCSDIKDLALNRTFDVVISHAGPLRIDYTPTRGYFFETYLASDADVEQAVGRVSNHLNQTGLLIMSIQTAPDREESTRSTSICRDLGGGYVATKTIIEAGNKRTKIRELKKDGIVIERVDHHFLVIDLEMFSALSARYNLYDQGSDSTNHFQIFKKSIV